MLLGLVAYAEYLVHLFDSFEPTLHCVCYYVAFEDAGWVRLVQAGAGNLCDVASEVCSDRLGLNSPSPDW